jgi:hypothetical protein
MALESWGLREFDSASLRRHELGAASQHNQLLWRRLPQLGRASSTHVWAMGSSKWPTTRAGAPVS